ncbi:MAG: NADH-quinone oxidoreductase subunit M [Fimbriimonadaceae bacterium]|nr:NADH-quinone oxidoreductase subunit M [Fimbriimonadaceae bacterium]QYK56814.1 MAG: NADH-quinone oxidoreductase subunit M [Fimbriimonadaceae bacterium]
MVTQPTGFGLISLLLLVPLLGALAISFVPEQFKGGIKAGAMVTSLLTFFVSIGVLVQFDSNTFHFQMVEFVPWIDQLGIHYRVGIDGISIWLVVLTTFLNVIAVWFSTYIEQRVKAYFVMMMLLLTAMLGVFVSLDLILFYTFFEASLIPMAVMIWIWGGANRNYAATKFFVYTFAASIFMLVGMIAMAQLAAKATGVLTFDMVALQSLVANGKLWTGAMQMQPLIFWSFVIAFMVKCPMFPFHTWLPDAHTEAPTAGSIILAGVLLKMGTYGFLRLTFPFFPEATVAAVPIIVGLGVVGILYGAIVAAMQPDVKKLVAYSSVAHMGFVVIGLFSLNHSGVMGGAYQQLSHGISTGALFLLIGLLYERIHTRLFADMGGLKARMPIYSALFLITMLSSVGLPGLNGFVGEFLAMLGLFESSAANLFGLNLALPALAGIGVILAAVYLLWMFQKVFYGKVTNPMLERIRDIKGWEIAMVGCLVVFMVWGGLYPNTFLKPMERAIQAARLMAVNPPGQRPDWADPSMEIDASGDLVRIIPRSPDNPDAEPIIVSVIAPANYHNDLAPEERNPVREARR